MKIIKQLCILLVVLLLGFGSANAAQSYIIPDSNQRLLQPGELWKWDYESLGYILNEIFARHGYDFILGGKYDLFFSERAWYSPNKSNDDNKTCYLKLSSLEWQNERLVKDIREEMRATGNYNVNNGKSIWDMEFESYQYLSNFKLIQLPANQKLPIYSGPGNNYYRGANDKAVCSTNGNVYACGFESGWLLTMYETNNGAVRVGYTPNNFSGNVDLPQLNFAYKTVTLTQNSNFTDDPVKTATRIARLPVGTQVTYLASFRTTQPWAYIEAMVNGKPTRGFVVFPSVGNNVLEYGEEITK